jgi:23S rRNA pseudouridine1911/1915/1917 synthase
MEPKIIYENEDFFVLDKPSGWIVNCAETTKGQKVLQEWLNNLDYPLSGNNTLRSGIVHRLDKETSGLLLVAKNESTFENLQTQFKERRVQKKYQALLHGQMDSNEGEIKATVGRLPWNRKRFGILPGGRESETKYKVLQKYEKMGKNFTLVEFAPKTGRTHQLRIHAKYIGHPIVADDFYAGRKTAREDRLWCPRLFLHACQIVFFDSRGKKQQFNSRLPSDLQESLLQLVKLV